MKKEIRTRVEAYVKGASHKVHYAVFITYGKTRIIVDPLDAGSKDEAYDAARELIKELSKDELF